MKIDDAVTFLVGPFSGVKPYNFDPYKNGRKFGRKYFHSIFRLITNFIV
jgi:hypothetical protein